MTQNKLCVYVHVSLANLLINPAVEQRSLHVAAPTAGRVAAQDGVVVGKDGPVLGDNVEEVDPTGLNSLGDVVVGCSCSEGREPEFMRCGYGTCVCVCVCSYMYICTCTNSYI